MDGSGGGTTIVNGIAAVKETAAIKETATMKGTAAMEEAAVLDERTPVCDCHCLRIEHHFRNRTEYWYHLIETQRGYRDGRGST